MSTHDGPGIRTTLFLKGCSLKCPWCHNPESIASRPEPFWTPARCIYCSRCVKECPVEAISFSEGSIRIDREACTKCGCCANVCPTHAIEMIGEEIDVAEAVKRARRDEPFYANSGGGVTISGGEPLLQPGAVAEVAGTLREHGIHVALDTSGAVAPSAVLQVLPMIDLLLFDVKLADERSYREIVRGDLSTMLATLRTAAEFIRDQGRPTLWIRTPVIPNVSDKTDVIGEIGMILARDVGDVVERWELCTFNPMATEKYRSLGVPWTYADTELISSRRGEELLKTAQAAIVGTDIDVLLMGMTRNE